MTPTSVVRGQEPEFVTDWRVVYGIVAVLGLMAAGIFVWTWIPPTSARTAPRTQVIPRRATTDEPGPVVTEMAAAAIPNLDVVVPWAPLPPERSLPVRLVENEPAVPAKRQAHEVPATQTPEQGQPPPDSKSGPAIPDLVAQLDLAVTLDFNPISPRRPATRGSAPPPANTIREPLTREQQLAQLANRFELTGIRFFDATECQLSPAETNELARISKGMARINLNLLCLSRNSSILSAETGFEDDVARLLQAKPLDATSVRALVQTLQVSSVGIRMQLVDALSGIPGPEATRALVDRALYDIASQVRDWAVVRLAARDREEYQSSLLRAFRYPLPAVAFHASEALVALGDVDALPALRYLLEQPSPCAPFVGDDGIWRKTELVRVNHFRNCLLCHPQSVSNADPVRSAIPDPQRPLSPTYPGARVSGEVVRADITYLRQDFSVLQPVVDHGPWPELQRFDYFLRARPLTEGEQREVDPAFGGAKHCDDYPQREAVRLAIAGLSKVLDGNGDR